MTDGTALLAAILADPADDTARLVYADWLEENGDGDRAEFIRVQVELARHPCAWLKKGVDHIVWPYCHGCREVAALRFRERELIAANAAPGWLLALPSSMRPILPDSIRDTFSRGFISSLTCTAADWLQHADAITAQQPVERVTLTTWIGHETTSIINGATERMWFVTAVERDDEEYGEVDFLRNREKLVQKTLWQRWPRIEFKLPPERRMSFTQTFLMRGTFGQLELPRRVYTVNNAPFNGFERGQVLLTNVHGLAMDEEHLEVQYQFEVARRAEEFRGMYPESNFNELGAPDGLEVWNSRAVEYA